MAKHKPANRAAKLYIYLPLLCAAAFTLIGGIYRYYGILKQLSFWNDENNAALYARAILWHGAPISETGYSAGLYQIGLYYITGLFFKVLGINELAARLPSVIIGSLMVIVVFFITRKLINRQTAVLTSFLTAFSQIQLAWSTQMRPYIWLEFFALITMYFCYLSVQNTRKIVDSNMLLAIIAGTMAFIFHTTGLTLVGLATLFLLYKILVTKKFYYFLTLLPIGALMLILLRFSFDNALPALFNLKFNFDLTHYKYFFRENYIWLLAGTAMGCYFMLKKNWRLAMVLITFVFVIFAVCIFKIITGYVRYSLPAFIGMYILFSYGVLEFSQAAYQEVRKWFRGHKIHIKPLEVYLKVLCLVATLIIFLGWPVYKGKILLLPKYYYTINADVRENPIVDYKTAFAKIRKMLHGRPDVIVMDAWNDRVPYYLPGQQFIFLNRYVKPGEVDPYYGEKMIATIAQFNQVRKLHKHGIVVVENWESMTAPDLQNYVRDHLKHEFDVNNLPYNEDDKWSISIYSYGL